MVTRAQSYLPPKSQPWGRNIEHSISNVEQQVRINASNTDNNLKQLNSSINVLTLQQNYLNSLITYTTLSPDTVTLTNVDGVATVAKTMTTIFTIDRIATVRISQFCDTEQNIVKNSTLQTPSALSFILSSVSGGSTTITNISPNKGVRPWAVITGVTINNYFTNLTDLSMIRIYTLNPGSYTVTGTIYSRLANADSGYNTFKNAIQTVEVIR